MTRTDAIDRAVREAIESVFCGMGPGDYIHPVYAFRVMLHVNARWPHFAREIGR